MKSSYWIYIGTSIITISLIVNIIYPKKNIQEYKIFQNLSYKTDWLTQAETPPEKDKLSEISVPEFTFRTQVSPQTTTLYIEFAVICEPECEQLWLEANGEQPPDQFTKFLLYHPQLDNLTRFYVSDNTLQFYQKKGEYETPLELFKKNPRAIIYTEPQIAAVLKIPANRYANLFDLDDFEKADYILTTYQFPKNQGKWRVGRVMNVSAIARDQEGYISWKLIHVSKTEKQPRIWMSQPNINYSN